MTSATATSNSNHSHHGHHSHSHHHPRRNKWALLQQRLRRNCLVGPATVCLLVIVGMPYVYNTEDFNWNAAVIQYVPMVEAVPFFRRAKVFGVVGGAAASVTSVEVADPIENEPEESLYDPLDLDRPENDNDDNDDSTTASESSSSSSSSSSATATLEPPTKKQKLRDTRTSKSKDKSSSSSVSSPPSSYNFPLFPDQDAFEGNPNAAIPFRYLDAHQKEGPARKATIESLKWRKQYQIDTILSRPHPNYDIAKRILPHYFVGRSAVTNHVVFIQRPGLSDLALAKHNDIVIQDMLLQYAYVFEYCWNVLHPHEQSHVDPDALMIGILDMQGLNLSILRKPELINFVKEFVGMIDAHYPTRAYKTYMINAPHWFSALYKIVSPIMRETTKEKIVLYSAGKEQDAALEQALGKDLAQVVNTALRLPDKKDKKRKRKTKKQDQEEDDLTLTSDILLETDMEQEIRNFVLKGLEQEGMQMKPVVSLAQPKPETTSS